MGKIFAFLTDKWLVVPMYREFLGFSKMVKNIKKSKGHEEGSIHTSTHTHTK